MGKGLKQRDLLYVSNANGTVNVYRYWQHTLVGVLTDFVEPEGACADKAGNVYITDHKEPHLIYEYAHGGTKAIRTLEDPQAPWACSVDPVAGNLAVANYRKESVSIYPHASGKPLVYKANARDHFISCAYDDRGDLLVASAPGYYGYYYYFYYLPKRGRQLILMNLPGGNRSSGRWFNVQGVAWDGKYWVVDAYNVLYRYTIDVQAKLISETSLSSDVGPIAIYRKDARGQGTQVVAVSSTTSGKAAVEYWHYPPGGSPVGSATQDLDNPYGVAISMGKK